MKKLGTFFHCLAVISCFILLYLALFVSSLSEKEILLQFKGNITSDPFNSLDTWDLVGDTCQDFSGVSCDSAGNVVKIVLWNTSLGGILSSALSGLKSLRILTLFGNNFSGNIPLEYGQLTTLWKINLSSNALSGSIPDFLGDLPNIRFLDLSENRYIGEIPIALFKNCEKTRFISFSHNNLIGSIPLGIGRCFNLEGLDLSYNDLTGGLPYEICSIPGLAYLSLRNNKLSGSVQDQVSLCESLKSLDLGSNSFSGSAPFRVLGFKNFTSLNISYNGFQGDVSDVVSYCSERLEFLDASFNSLIGEIPSSISRCIGLKYLDLSSNVINGSIPFEIASLKDILVIRLGNNSIYGTIPKEIGDIELLQALDLNNLHINGDIPNELSNCRLLRELDLSANSLQGSIPEKIYNMSYLLKLNLNRNEITGIIPETLGNLSNLHFLDLSENLMSGLIPLILGNLKNLTFFNVSFNNLSGLIPNIQNIVSFGPSAFDHNPGLCGYPLDVSCSSVSAGGTIGDNTKKPKLRPSAIVAIVAAALILIGVCLTMIINTKARTRREEMITVVESTPIGSTDSELIIGKLVLFSKSLPAKYEDWEAGTKALMNKDCLIGAGSIGTVYKTTFENGISIAVKKIETLGRIANQDGFEQEIGQLGNLQHDNLVPIQGYYWSDNMKLILSQFVQNGNLYDNLHALTYPGPSRNTGNPELNWSRRFRIALGTAKALAYLHLDCKPPILHLNVKSTNILLDKNYEPKLSDFGLDKFLPLLDNNGLTKVHNAVGYVAPELSRSSRLDDKYDVYSFGVILLELVTGRKPVERVRSSNEVVVLKEHVKGLIERGGAKECFDKSLRGYVENELIQVMKLGLICSNETPLKRPSMVEVVQFLESIRNGLES